VLGLATDEERRELDALARRYPEIAEARDRFEQQLEASLLADAPAPPAFLKERIGQAIAGETARVVPVSHASKEQAPVRNLNPWKWVAAAAVLLLAGSLYWAVSINNRIEQLQGQATDQARISRELEETRRRLEAMQNEKEALQKPDVKSVDLAGLPTAPKSSVTVFWDSTNKDVYLMVRNLPRPANDRQYQLWALIDNKPVDLGVFELRQERLVVKMKNVQKAQAFAITLEPKGGSASPTGNMYVYGKL